ncbi:type IV pilus assembly protein PilV [Microbulbifer donghaiensis]|uniref:Type IV pilus assembly protein PilV n=1 Tax=Microbulbifer donghaiensis TaxID=494016 RepID=A0A1M5HW56_9GAMM|nr:type IV pilus modification protein PilV [Microbulbifer donghaiensis]SHG20092.1 type IV pilus assembly protein PilV [Microbulbifer donghaiensis]
MNKQAGATLMEVLITVLILAVGLLGLSATQVMSLKNANNSHNRYLAGLAAQEMADRIRANPKARASYNNYDTASDGSETEPGCGATCVAQDKYEWKQVIEANLPSGQGEIDVNGDQVTLTVTWKEQHTGKDRGTSAAVPEEFSYQLVVEL